MKENDTVKIIINSCILIVQPLLQNVISVVVTGYVARTFGQEKYGAFLYSLAYIFLFLPITNLGLRTILVRDLSNDRQGISIIAGKMIVGRAVLGLLAMAAVGCSIIIVEERQDVINCVLIASILLLFQSIYTTIFDIFQAYERMDRVAFCQFLQGTTIAILSFTVVFTGAEIAGLMVVYALGNLVCVVTSVIQMYRAGLFPIYCFDFKYIKQKLIEGLPFSLPGIVSNTSNRIGIVLLLNMAGDIFAGTFGAAMALVEKLLIIPDGLCTAMFPTMIIQDLRSRSNTIQLFRNIFRYSICLAIPICIGMFLLSDQIIYMIFGQKFAGAASILRILSVWFLLSFITCIFNWTLAAIRRESANALISYLSNILLVILGVILIPQYKDHGLAAAYLGSSIVAFTLSAWIIRRDLCSKMMANSVAVSLVAINVLNSLIILALRDTGIAICIAASVAFYAAALYKLRVVILDEFRRFLPTK